MKEIVIQEYARNRFCGRGEHWVNNPGKALHFDSSVHAADYAIAHHIQDRHVLSYTSEPALIHHRRWEHHSIANA